MKRNVKIEEISDGKLYTCQDLVRADCQGCAGCSDCCRGMGTSVVLDPMDVWNLVRGTGQSLGELLQDQLELNLVDGMILPNLRMSGPEEKCAFLDKEGRCSVHPFRPGICRLFPLGRIYEEEGFRYFLQVHECSKKSRSKIKVKKWIGLPDIAAYEAYICSWHDFLKDCRQQIETLGTEELRILQMYLLRVFYQTPFEEEDFYRQFAVRMAQVREKLGL